MNDTKHETEWERLSERARAALDRRAAALDAACLSRLAQARYRALDAAALTATASTWGHRFGAVLATLAVVAVLAWQLGGESDELDDELIVREIDLMTFDEDLELVEEPEFYHWLNQELNGPDKA